MYQFTVFCATADPKLKDEDGALEAAGAGAGVVPKVNVDEELALVVEAGVPKLKPLEGVTDTEVTVVDAGAGFATAPKDPKVGALSVFLTPKENPELAVGFDSVETGTELLSPKVNVEADGVVEAVDAGVADAPKLNVEGAVGAKVATVDVVALLESKIEVLFCY